MHLLEYFLLPFVALVAVVAFAPVEAWLPRVLAIVAVALASLFAVVGLLEEATQRLIFYTPAVEIGNAYSSFFRVTSLFRDPSLYGRHVVLGLAVVIVLLWSRRLGIALAVVIAGLLFAGLFFSYSQSSLTALFAVLLAVAVLAGDRLVRVAAVGIAVVLVASGAAFVGSRVASASTERITSDRSRRIELTARDPPPPFGRSRARLAAAGRPAPLRPRRASCALRLAHHAVDRRRRARRSRTRALPARGRW